MLIQTGTHRKADLFHFADYAGSLVAAAAAAAAAVLVENQVREFEAYPQSLEEVFCLG
jgi:hypothetical protein